MSEFENRSDFMIMDGEPNENILEFNQVEVDQPTCQDSLMHNYSDDGNPIVQKFVAVYRGYIFLLKVTENGMHHLNICKGCTKYWNGSRYGASHMDIDNLRSQALWYRDQVEEHWEYLQPGAPLRPTMTFP